ncbi:hypothetical protein HDU81_010665 [Chytriomyces hyalinus]|nr:hypothetical protein HDU81_010665 [Chytriomyces hyalinus]
MNSKRRTPTLRERERVYDVNLVTREMPLYEPLLDEGLQDYFSSSNIRKHLVNVGLISGDNHVIPKRQFNRNQVHLDRVAHEERNCKTEEERELDRDIENVENSKKYPEYLSAYPVTMWKAAMLYAEKPPALELTEKQLFSQLTKMSARRLREYGLDPNKVIPQLHHIKSKAKLKRVAPSVIEAKKAEVHDDLSEMEMEAEKMSPALKLFEMAKNHYEKRDVNATKMLLHELVRIVGGMPPSVSPVNSSEELDMTQEISSLSSVPLENSEIMLIGYIKKLGGNVDKILKQIEASKRSTSCAPTTSNIQTKIGRLSAPVISGKMRPSTARPSREAEYPIGSEFSDFGSDCGYEVTSQIMAVKEDLVSKASRTVDVVQENDENNRNSAAERGAILAENMNVPELEYDIQSEEMFEDFTDLENAPAAKEVEQRSIYESHPVSEQNLTDPEEQNQLHEAVSEDFVTESLQQHPSGSFTSQSSIADNVDVSQSRDKKDVSASMDYIAAISAVEEPSEAVEQTLTSDNQSSSALQESESMSIHDERIDTNELHSALEEFFEKAPSNPSIHEIAAETCETLTADDPYNNYPADELAVDENSGANVIPEMQIDDEGHIHGVAQYESPQSISKETLTDAAIHEEATKSQTLDENLAERPIVEPSKADWEGDFDISTPPPEPVQEENTAASFETISSFGDGYLVDDRSMSEPNIANEESAPAEDKNGEVDQATGVADSSQATAEGEVLEHDVGTDPLHTDEERIDEGAVLDATAGHLNHATSIESVSQKAISDGGKGIGEGLQSNSDTNESHIATSSWEQYEGAPPPEELETSTAPISQSPEDRPGQVVAASAGVPLDEVDNHSPNQVTEISPVVNESILSRGELSEESGVKESEVPAQLMQNVTLSSNDARTAELDPKEPNNYEEIDAVDSDRSAALKLEPEALSNPNHQNKEPLSESELNAHIKSTESINYEDDFDVAGIPAADEARVEGEHVDGVAHYEYASDDNIAEPTGAEDGIVQEMKAVEAEFSADDVSSQVDNESKSATTGVNSKSEEGVILSETTAEPTLKDDYGVGEIKADDEWELDEAQNQSVHQAQDHGPSESSMSLSNGYGDDFEEAATLSSSHENIDAPSVTANTLETDGDPHRENADVVPLQSKNLASSSVSGSKRSVTFSQTLEQPETAPLQINTRGNGTVLKNSPSINLNGSTASIASEEEYTVPPFLNRKSIISDRKPSMFVSSLIRRASKLSPTSMEGTISFPPAYSETMDDLIDSVHGRPSRQMLDRRPSAKSPLNVTLPVDSDSESEEGPETVIKASAVLGASPTTANQVAHPQDSMPNTTASAATVQPSEASNLNLSNLNNKLASSVGDTTQEQGMKPTISRLDLSSASKPSSRPQSIVTINRVGAASSSAISPCKEGSSPSLNVVSNLPRKSRLQQVAGTSNPSISLNGSITSLSSSNGDSDSDYVSPTFMTRASISPDRKSSMLVTSLIRRASHASPTSTSPGLIVSKMSPTHDDTEDLMDSVFRRPSRMLIDRRQSMRSPLATSLPADSDSETEDDDGNTDVEHTSQNQIGALVPASHEQPPNSTSEKDSPSRTNELPGQQSDTARGKISESNDAVQGAESYHEVAPMDSQKHEESKLETQTSSDDFVTPRESSDRKESVHAGNLDAAEKFETPRQSVLSPEGAPALEEDAKIQEKTTPSESDVLGSNVTESNEQAEMEPKNAEPISATEHQSTDSMNLAALLHSVLDLKADAKDGNDDAPGSSESHQETNHINALAHADQISSTSSVHESHHSIASLPEETSPILEEVMKAVNMPSVTKAPESLETLNLAQLFQSVLNLNDVGARATELPGDAVSSGVKSPARSGSVRSQAASVHSIHSQASERMNARYKSVPSLSSRQESKANSRKTSDAHVSNQQLGTASSSKMSSIANLPKAASASTRSSLTQPAPPKEPKRTASGLSKSASKNASAVSLNITNRIKSVPNVGSRQGSQSSLIQQAAKPSSNISDKRSAANSRSGSVSASPLNTSSGRLANQSQRSSVAENKAPPKLQSSKPTSKSQTQKNSIAASRRASANASQQSLLVQALATAASLLESSSSASSQTASPELKEDGSRLPTASQQETKQAPVPHAPLSKSTSSKSSSASSLRGSSYRLGKQNATGKSDASNSETPRTSMHQNNDMNSSQTQESEAQKAAGVSVWDDILYFGETKMLPPDSTVKLTV